ncbi:helix-turn-helix domain-containing protein [Aeromonas rivipollensis]|uniref:helix-turn-helix domain-containing protein n=1 Tax=Aeromonas rivipollensis TaxID=948519 RepID=UPI0039BD3754
MQPTILSHSDQVVATLAKLPIATFGTLYTKEVALVLARHMNKAQGWSACLYLRSIAKAIGCTTRTVRNALRRLEALGFIKTEHRKHDQIDNWNLASVYRLGSALRALFRTPSTPRPAKSLTSSKQKQSNKERSPSSSSVGKFSMFDQKRAAMTQEDWEVSQQASQANNRNALAKLKALFGRGQQ